MPTMDTQRAAELQVLLEGVPLPASKQELVAYARSQDAAAAEQLSALPDRSYDRIDEVGEELAPTEPRRPSPVQMPRAESGKPPGGSDYLQASPTSGAVRAGAPAARPPQQAVAKQTKTKKRQKKVQQGTPRRQAHAEAEEQA